MADGALELMPTQEFAFRWGVARKARIWIGHLPASAVFAGRVALTRKWVGRPDLRLVPRACGVEFASDGGGPSSYGLLGAIVVPEPDEALYVQINSSDREEMMFESPLVGDSTRLVVGLPSEFIDGVVAGIGSELGACSTIPCGRLIVNCAAHSIEGSSSVGFAFLSIIVTHLLIAPHERWIERDMPELFATKYRKIVEMYS